MSADHPKLRPGPEAKGSGPWGQRSPIGFQTAWASSLLQNQSRPPTKGEAGPARPSEVRGAWAGVRAFSGSRPTPRENPRGCKARGQESEPRQRPSRAPGEGRKRVGWEGGRGLAHGCVSMAPLLIPSTPGQGQLAGNADPPKTRAIFARRILLHLIKALPGENIFMGCGRTDVPQGGSSRV